MARRFSWGGVAWLSLALALGLCLCPASPVLGQMPSFTENWIGSGDPCLPFKRLKRHLIQTGRSKAALVKYGQCIPVKFTIIRDVVETYQRPAGYGTDRARIALGETYSGYLQIMRCAPGECKGTDSFKLVGPAPCCPGKTESYIMPQTNATITVTDAWGKIHQLNTSSLQEPIIFKTDTDPRIEFEWMHLNPSLASGFVRTKRIRIRRGAIPKGYHLKAGTLSGAIQTGNRDLTLRGSEAISAEEILRGLERGVLIKTFPVKARLATPRLRYQSSTQGTVQVKMEFGEQNEIWLVRITAREERNEDQFLTVRPAGQDYLKLPVVVQYDWDITGELIIERSKKSWSYKEGRIKAARLSRTVLLTRPDLCSCHAQQCQDRPHWDIRELIGANLAGARVGGGVKLGWSLFGFTTGACVECLPKRMYMVREVSRHRFGAQDLLGPLSKLVIPLRDGYSKRGTLGKGLKYRITLTRKK